MLLDLDVSHVCHYNMCPCFFSNPFLFDDSVNEKAPTTFSIIGASQSKPVQVYFSSVERNCYQTVVLM